MAIESVLMDKGVLVVKPKHKIHPIMVFALFVNSIVAAIITVRNFINESMIFAYIFLFIFGILATMTVTAIKHNKNFKEEE